MSRVWTIARRDTKAMFDQPTGYVVLIVFLGINAFMFFRNAYLLNVASLRPMLDLLPWLFLFFVPAIAMRSLAEDSRSGVLEVVLAHPVSEAELVLGKFLGVLVVLVGALALTLFIPLGLRFGGHVQWGPVVAQYVGAGLLAVAFGAIGVWASSLGRSQITAFILAVAVMFALILVGLNPLLVGLPPALGAIAANLGVLSHFESVGRGVLDLRDVLYFLSVAALFLVLAYQVLMRRRLAPRSRARAQLRLGTLLLCAVVVVLNLAGSQIGGRLDLTPGKAYTLSRGTRVIAGALPDLVSITLYASKELPTQYALERRYVTDLLHDVRGAGHGRIRVFEKDPSSDQKVASTARQLGIVPVQFNVVGQSSLQVKNGYFGLVVQYAGKHQTIPFIRQTNDLEYRLASALRGLTRTSKPTIALLADSGAGSFSVLRQQLEKSYRVITPRLSDSAQTLDGAAVVVIAAAPDTVDPEALRKVGGYLAHGGKALVMGSGLLVSPRMPYAISRPIGWNTVLAPYGVQIKPDVVYDLRANQLVTIPTSYGQVLQRYPYFLRAQSTRASPIDADLDEVSLAWPSTVDTTASPSDSAVPLLVTTAAAGVARGQAMIDPRANFPTTQLGRRILAVQVSQKHGGKGARLVVVGDEYLAGDEFVQRDPGNLTFALNAVDWLAQDEALISIRAKNRNPPALMFASSGLRASVKYGNMAVIPVLVALFGVVRLVERRRSASAPYRPVESAT